MTKSLPNLIKTLFNPHILLVCLGMLLCLTGCQNDSEKELKDSMQNRILRINNQGDISSLNPHTGIDLQCRIFQKALFEGLTRINPEGVSELAGAECVEISPCQTIYTFTLRPMLWSNGEKVTAFHFEESWRRALSPKSDCLRSDLFYPIKNAKKVKKGQLPLSELGFYAADSQTFVVELEHPTPYFLNLISSPLFSALYDESSFPEHINGPFKIAAFESQRMLVLEKNPLYWDAPSINLDRIEVSLVSDPNTALLMYEKGELDWIGHPFTLLPHDAIDRFAKSHEFSSKPISAVYWLCLNTQSFPLNSAKLRRALSVALNRQDLAQHVMPGEIPSKSAIPITLSLHGVDEIYRDSDFKEANRLFQEALVELNLKKEEFPALKFSHSDVPGQKKLAEAIQQQWEQTLGIKVELTGHEWNVFFSNLGERQYQIGGCNWFSAFHDPICTLEFFKDRTHRYNAPQWESAEYQNLLELADKEIDPERRRQHLKDAEAILFQEMPIIPLCTINTKYLKTPSVKGLFISDLGHADFKWAEMVPKEVR